MMIRLVLCCVLLGACSSSVSLDTGLDGEVKLSELEEVQARGLCAAVVSSSEQLIDNNREGACKFSGALQASFAASLRGEPGSTVCEMATEQCLGEPSMAEANCEISGFRACEVSVRQFEDCYNDVMDAFAGILDRLASASCESLVSGETRLNEEQAPTSCQLIEAQCPMLELEIGEVRMRTPG